MVARVALVERPFEIYQADCVEVLAKMPDSSVHFTMYSPPFISLYTFSDDPRDFSNCRDEKTFWQQYKFMIAENYRVTKPGRLVAVHCMQLPTSKVRDGFIGIRDFRGDIIRAHQKAGFVFHSEVCIWKDPVTAMQRTKAIGLLHKQVVKDSTMSRMGLADYIVVFRKPGVNQERVSGEFEDYHGSDPRVAPTKPKRDAVHVADSYSVKVWQRYASPVWLDIKQGDVLSYRGARAEADERHISPLQLTPIRRCLELWTNPGDVVLSPFAGIGSEGVVALEMGRKFIGAELKASYHKQAVANLKAAAGAKMFT